MVEILEKILKKYKANILSMADLHKQIQDSKKTVSNNDGKVDEISGQIKELLEQKKLNETIVQKYDNKFCFPFMMCLTFTLISILAFLISITGFAIISGKLPILFGMNLSKVSSLALMTKNKASVSFTLSLLLGGVVFPVLKRLEDIYLEYQYENNLEYKNAKDENDRIKESVKELERTKEELQEESNDIKKQIKQKEDEIRRLVQENEVLIGEYDKADAQNKMNQAINQDWDPEVAHAISVLNQVKKEYKPSEDKRKAYSLFSSN